MFAQMLDVTARQKFFRIFSENLNALEGPIRV
jgi:hypothetical protein